jgi:hypothetical protein
MKFATKVINIFSGCLQLAIPPALYAQVAQLQQAANSGKELEVEITIQRKRRSLNANAYLWQLLGQMAAVLRTDKDEVYLTMLERYGVYTHICVKPAAVEKVKKEWRTVRELGEVTINGQKAIQLQCYFGSHSYNSKEFSVLLNGVLDEAKELGIETLSKADKDLLLKEWGAK